MTVTCKSGVELLMDYLEGLLAPDLRAALEQHVAACQRCAAFVESYRRTPTVLRAATDVSLPAGVERALLNLLHTRMGEDEEGPD
jgi:anti-sigma factor RsiW